MCVVFKGSNLPNKIVVSSCVLGVSKPYVSNPRMCYKCGSFGYTSKFCSWEERCLTCAGSYSKDLNCTA